MTPERWHRLRAAIEAALEASSGEARDAALTGALGGDLTLLSEARSMLRAAQGTHGFLGSPPTLTAAGAGGTADQRPELLGRTLGHYRVEERLGAGGMGEVFRARDLALGRECALKVLPRQVRPDLRERLVREAEAAARLQHPAIATFFEAGVDGDEAFIAMEFVRGETLRTRLARGPLPFDDSLAVASCLLGALGHAHAAGLLHCDIKPENLMLIGPRSAKLLDFGLALRVAGNAPDAALHGERPVVGTPGYMSPEQVLGGTLDARSDLFQAGIVLYECLTARAAFSGQSPYERLAAVMTRRMDVAVLAGQGVRPDLAPILARALSHDREHRYPSAMAFSSDLAALREGRVETELADVVAVVDFENLSRDPESDWLAVGIAQTLMADLARVGGLEVLPRPRVSRALAQSKRKHCDPAGRDLEAGLALGCRWVVSGGYESAGATLRLRAHVTDIFTGQGIECGDVAGALDDVFAMQSRLAQNVAARLRPSASLPPNRKGAAQIRAYELVTRASALVTQLRREALDQAIAMLEEALRLDADHAPAHAALAHAHDFRAIATTNAEDLERAVEHADRAIALDPQNAEAHKWKGYALWRQQRWAEAAPALRRAVDLAPNDPQAHYFVGAPSFMEGARQEALPYLQRSLELEPLNAMGWLALGTAHLTLMRLPEARYALVRCLDLERNPQGIFPTAGAAAFLAEALRIEGRLPEARSRALEGIEAAEASDHAYRDVFRAFGLCVLGRIMLQEGDVDGARAAYGRVVAHLRGRTRPRSCGHLMVQALAGLGRTGDAAAFEEGLRLHETHHTWNFERFNGCLPDQGLLELARAAQGLGRGPQAQALLARAREAGSQEPLDPPARSGGG